MTECKTCGRKLSSQQKSVVYLASDAMLCHHIYLRRLKAAMRMHGVPRRKWRDLVADALRDFDGVIIDHRGMAYEPPCVDDAFPKDEAQRSISDFIKEPSEGIRPRLSSRSIRWVRLVDLYFRINFPELIKEFGPRIQLKRKSVDWRRPVRPLRARSPL